MGYITKVLCEGDIYELQPWYVKRSDLLRALAEENMDLNVQEDEEPIELEISKVQLEISIKFMEIVR